MAGGVAALAAAAWVMAATPALAQTQQESPTHGAPAPGQSLLSGLPPASLGGPCLRSGKAYLRARIRGAVRADIDLHGAALRCEGGPRHDGSGIRMGFEGRVPRLGRVRMIFGIDRATEGRAGRELPTNLTVFFGDEKRLFATQGDGNCTVDRLTQEPVSARHAPTRARGDIAKSRAHSTAGTDRPEADGARTRSYRVVAHGFCIAPVNDIARRRRIVVTTFDFAGRADFDTPDTQ